MTSSCTLAEPCELFRALQQIDPARPIVRMLPGNYQTSGGCGLFNCGMPPDLVGYGATITPTGGAVAFEVIGAASTRIAGLTLGAGSRITCGSPPEGGPGGAVGLMDVTSYGTITVSAGQLSATRSEFHGANAIGAGGRAVVSIDRSLFDGQGGTAMQCNQATLSIANSKFVDSQTAVAHGALCNSAITFSTFVDAPVACDTGTNVRYLNDIFFSSTAAPPVAATSNCRYSYDLIFPASNPPNSDNIINADPLFVDAAHGDLHLQSGSPAVDSADPAVTGGVDFEGTVRPQGLGLDRGAYERKP